MFVFVRNSEKESEIFCHCLLMKFDVAYRHSPTPLRACFLVRFAKACPHGFRFNLVRHGCCSGIGPRLWYARQGRALEGRLETDVCAARVAYATLFAQDRVP